MVCPRQAFPPRPSICLQSQEPGAPALLSIIKLRRRGLQRTNALAYLTLAENHCYVVKQSSLFQNLLDKEEKVA
jgi:hypothetical protein